MLAREREGDGGETMVAKGPDWSERERGGRGSDGGVRDMNREGREMDEL